MAKTNPIPTDPRFKDLTGQRYGRWLVVGYIGRRKKGVQPQWLCRCDCGLEKPVFVGNLRGGGSLGCRNCYNKNQPSTPLKERFMQYVGPLRPDGCMDWMGATVGKEGRGHIATGYRNGKYIKDGVASRLAYEIANGPISDDMVVRHTCDRPSCVNPAHLALGTYEDNSRDMVERGRSMRGERANTAKLTADDVVAIRQAHASGETQVSLAKRYGVRQTQISNIVLRISWKHVP